MLQCLKIEPGNYQTNASRSVCTGYDSYQWIILILEGKCDAINSSHKIEF